MATTYITADDLRAALADAGGPGTQTAGTILADERLEAAIVAAEGEVMGRLAGGFTIPEAAPDYALPGMVADVVTAIAAYLATLEAFGSQALEDRDPVVLRYQRARELLAGIVSGAVTVPGLPPREDGATLVPSEATTYGDVGVDLTAGFEPGRQGYGYGRAFGDVW